MVVLAVNITTAIIAINVIAADTTTTTAAVGARNRIRGAMTLAEIGRGNIIIVIAIVAIEIETGTEETAGAEMEGDGMATSSRSHPSKAKKHTKNTQPVIGWA